MPRMAPADVEKVRKSDNHWALYVDVGEGVEVAHGGQSSVSVGVDFPHVGVGCHGRGFDHRQGAHGAAHTCSHAHRKVHHTPYCPQVEARSSDPVEGTLVIHGGVTVGTGA